MKNQNPKKPLRSSKFGNAAMEVDKLASQVAILTVSFEKVPAEAIPALLDCVLASSCLSPLSLFSALVESFTNFVKVGQFY